VVIDEVHMYRGVFGSHASLIFRRLNRLCDHYNASPQYICCSATIGNPVEHAATVTGQDETTFRLVDDDGSASGDRHWLFWNPRSSKTPTKTDRFRTRLSTQTVLSVLAMTNILLSRSQPLLRPLRIRRLTHKRSQTSHRSLPMRLHSHPTRRWSVENDNRITSNPCDCSAIS